MPVGTRSETAIFCYECHEELLHNPIFLSEDIKKFAALCVERGLVEQEKTESREAIAGRIKLLHEIIQTGLNALTKCPPQGQCDPEAKVGRDQEADPGGHV